MWETETLGSINVSSVSECLPYLCEAPSSALRQNQNSGATEEQIAVLKAHSSLTGNRASETEVHRGTVPSRTLEFLCCANVVVFVRCPVVLHFSLILLVY